MWPCSPRQADGPCRTGSRGPTLPRGCFGPRRVPKLAVAPWASLARRSANDWDGLRTLLVGAGGPGASHTEPASELVDIFRPEHRPLNREHDFAVRDTKC